MVRVIWLNALKRFFPRVSPKIPCIFHKMESYEMELLETRLPVIVPFLGQAAKPKYYVDISELLYISPLYSGWHPHEGWFHPDF